MVISSWWDVGPDLISNVKGLPSVPFSVLMCPRPRKMHHLQKKTWQVYIHKFLMVHIQRDNSNLMVCNDLHFVLQYTHHLYYRVYNIYILIMLDIDSHCWVQIIFKWKFTRDILAGMRKFPQGGLMMLKSPHYSRFSTISYINENRATIKQK